MIFQDESYAKDVKKLSDAIHDNYLRQRREEKKRKSEAAAVEKRTKMMKREEEEEEIKEEKVDIHSINVDSSQIKIENGRNGRSCKKRDSYKFQDDDDTEQAEEEEDESEEESEDPVTTVNGGLDVERTRSPLRQIVETVD